MIKTVVYELQYLLIQRWGYVPENHNVVRNQHRTEYQQHLSTEDIVSVTPHPRNFHRIYGH